MIGLRAIQKLLIFVLLAVFVISTLLIIYIGIGLVPAMLWNFLNIIGAAFPVEMALVDTANVLAFTSSVLDIVGELIITILLTSIFYQLLGKINIKKSVIAHKIKGLNRHIIITPANGIAINIAKMLKKNNIPFIVVDPQRKEVDSLIDEGMLAVQGDASQANALVEARVDRASNLLVLDSEDIKNVMIAVTAKRINNRLRIASRIKKLEDTARMKRVGINYFVLPEVAIGDEIAASISSTKSKQ
jgi:voltage-gated potassium channel